MFMYAIGIITITRATKLCIIFSYVKSRKRSLEIERRACVRFKTAIVSSFIVTLLV